MARTREEFSKILHDILGSDNVYFNPPEDFKMSYPAIRYSLQSKKFTHANNKKYIKRNKYIVTVIDKNPDSKIPEKLEELQYSIFDRAYKSDNLNHFTYIIYF
jgi:hypothetical protein